MRALKSNNSINTDNRLATTEDYSEAKDFYKSSFLSALGLEPAYPDDVIWQNF
jgi:hypothetical protein